MGVDWSQGFMEPAPPDLKGVLLPIVMAALKCATHSCVSKVKRDAHALLANLWQS